MRKEIYALVFILLLALGLRLYQLDQENIWTDEALTIHHAQEQDWPEFIHFISTTEAAPPGHYLFLHYWISWFSDSEFSVRLPSVIFGVLSVWLLFLVVRKFFDQKVALLSSLFMATSMLQILFSQEARLYSLFTFLVLLSAYFFRGINERSGMAIGYFCTIAAALYVNYLAMLVMLFYSVILWLGRKNLSGKFLWAGSLIHLFIVGGMSLLLWPILRVQFSILNNGLSDIFAGKGLPSFLASLGLFLYVLPAIFFIGGLLFLLWLKPFFLRAVQHPNFDFFFSVLVIAAGSVFLYASVFPVSVLGIALTSFPITHSYFLIRHSFFLVPLWYIFLAWKISSLKWKQVAVVMTIIVLMVSGTALYEYYTQTTKAEWQDATAFIASQNAGVPLILLDKGSLANEFMLDYYYPGEYRLLKLTVSDQPREFMQLPDEGVLSQLQRVPNEEKFWLVLARNTRTGYHYRDLLDKYYTRIAEKKFEQVEVYGYAEKSFSAS